MNLWTTNLQILRQRFNALAQQLAQYQPIALPLKEARNGLAVPIYQDQPLHSLYDPMKEAQKMLPPTGESYLVIGLGAGYLAKSILAQSTTALLLIIEPSPCDLANLLATLDYTDILNDPRLILLSNKEISPLFQQLAHLYQPLLHGNLHLIHPRLMQSLYPTFFDNFTQAWQAWMHQLSGELSTWHFFGRRWFKNIVTNLATITPENSARAIPSQTDIFIAGAGPSLEDAIVRMKKEHKRPLIIASDAAALTLQAHQLPADLILSIDAQALVQYHFLGLDLKPSTLIADLSVHPALHRSGKSHFFAGSHPLARLSGLRHLPTDSGNVGTTAYLLAKYLGAKSIRWGGLDFAYLHGKPYANPNYLYCLYEAQASRLQPISQNVAQLTFRTAIHYYPETGHYQSDLLAFYQTKFHQAQTLHTPKTWHQPSIDGIKFLKNYHQQLIDLAKRPIDAWHALSPNHRTLLYTLLPSMSTGYQMGLRTNQLIEETLNFALTSLKDKI
ncbi:6-hydroxymethylpterin diphosphokinase MptE-like protein [Entomospira culicis]|uniref:DUF115 domain-containing protein n=1 Tax=Entomospira culicis TaxID=2719989 RepID=A0A968GHR7_9SPIO|nr:6-hydroxymethylpterin diphosphokinase MptE-like protein [Entomospira culicis]NIZ19852.1 DUF115 domain-containing protein [Entomospira culicis]NIZ70066.1 DUF115 domain-containing protein [Entomospira culicis]WDI37170.1 DUF115 domain-containing protein [Entomospira culicis]WDI38799.1 DUF115 domain-containing protein [Entomospira culicis]